MARNVLGSEQEPCSFDPLTGFTRDGCCNSHGEDAGVHLVCAEMTEAFLAFSYERGNDLTTPMPEYGFEGLKEHPKTCAAQLVEIRETVQQILVPKYVDVETPKALAAKKPLFARRVNMGSRCWPLVRIWTWKRALEPCKQEHSG